MRTETIRDPLEFRQRAAPLLVDEARHNLMLGIVGTIVSSPDTYPEYRLYLVTEGGEPRSAAVITPPYDLVVTDTAEPAAIAALVEALVEDGFPVPGALANQPTIDLVVREWERATGDRARRQMAQGVFALTETSPVQSGPGEPRRAVASDQALIEEWMKVFLSEALPDEPYDDARMARTIAGRLSADGPDEYWLWEDDGEVVAWTGHGNPTGKGIRIGPVYTPPELRGKGYATGLVAAQSRWLLDNGYEFCFLYTDLANPTSNAIYERIGYRRVAEAAKYEFETSE